MVKRDGWTKSERKLFTLDGGQMLVKKKNE